MDKGFLEDCLAQGMSLEAIGKATGKHSSTVGYWMQKHSLRANGATRNAPKGGLTRDELEPLVDEGLTIEGIAQRLGIGDTTVRHWLKRHELKTHLAQRRTALTDMRRTGQREIEAECRKHGRTRHVSVPSERRLRCKKCRAEAVSRRRRKVKEILVAEAGGKCLLRLCAERVAQSHFRFTELRAQVWLRARLTERPARLGVYR